LKGGLPDFAFIKAIAVTYELVIDRSSRE
jgi:hypothetical protein